MVEIQFSVTGLRNTLTVLQFLPENIVSKRGGPVREALAKGARYIRNEERISLARSLELRQEKGLSTGLLQKSVIFRRSKNLFFRGERYVVRISRKVYSNNTDPKPVTTLKTAHIMEYGSEKQQATPFIRPTFERTKDRAFQIVVKELDVRIAKVIKSLPKGRR